jgi:hypothetical protein
VQDGALIGGLHGEQVAVEAEAEGLVEALSVLRGA